MKFRTIRLQTVLDSLLRTARSAFLLAPSSPRSPAFLAVARGHIVKPNDTDLLRVFNCDAAMAKWTVPEAAHAARELWGDTAVTAIAWCAVSARCDGRTDEYRFWFRVFAYLEGDFSRHGERDSIARGCSYR